MTQEKVEEYTREALAMARSLASNPEIVRALDEEVNSRYVLAKELAILANDITTNVRSFWQDVYFKAREREIDEKYDKGAD